MATVETLVKGGTVGREYDSAAYRRGWEASLRGSVTALDRADARGEVTEWYDGYHDEACERPKYHSRDFMCDGRGSCRGECVA